MSETNKTPFINYNWLLKTDSARRLYHEFAEKQPIIDYHCHLDPKAIADDKKFSDLGELMLGGDHYKWRAMRSFGIDEKFITGDASFREKFRAYATMLPYAIGNPLFAWTALELKRYFGIDKTLNRDNADEIFDKCSEMLQDDAFSTKSLIQMSNVVALCTTDDPLDSLEYHEKIDASGFETKVLPAFRPDKAVNIHKSGFVDYIAKTGVHNYSELKSYLSSRLDFFASHGCRLSDHGLDYVPFRTGNASAVFEKVMCGGKATDEETEIYMTDLLLFCAEEYAKRGWVMQLHFGPMRNNSTRMFEQVGPDTGFDSISDTMPAIKLCKLLDSLDNGNMLPKTILYSLSGLDNQKLAALMGSFQRGPVRSKIQLGAGWWFNDTKDGMEAQLKCLANHGILGCFVGMLTDSRSFISYPRHEYFRRIFCDLLGSWIENGEYPEDAEILKEITEGVCCKNALNYFNF